MPVERSELQLVWPSALFRTEATELLNDGFDDEDTLGWLLAEAFADDRGYRLFSELYRQKSWFALENALHSLGVATGQLGTAPGQTALADSRPARDPATELVRELLHAADSLPRCRPKRYYSQRRRQRQPDPALALPELKTEFARTVRQLEDVGYFEDSFGSRCPDAPDDDPAAEGQRRLTEVLGTDAPVWPLGRLGEATGTEKSWDEELFFDVIEALHDQVARPRRRFWHDYHREWDYTDFARRPGQSVYRWRVNALLGRSEVSLRLADSGPDAGLLIESPDDTRGDLVKRALRTPEPRVRDRVAHAIAQFRRREAPLAAKREATRALADVLEQRKALLKRELFSSDANALFQIANQFDIRHMNEQQKTDYPPAFLDWVFWWYLATIELTDRLLAEQRQA